MLLYTNRITLTSNNLVTLKTCSLNPDGSQSNHYNRSFTERNQTRNTRKHHHQVIGRLKCNSKKTPFSGHIHRPDPTTHGIHHGWKPIFFAKKWQLTEGGGHKAGFLALMSVLKYCYEIGVKYVTVYAFSIDNFNRRPDEVQYVMDLMQEKIEGFLKELTIVNKYGVRVLFIGDLKRLYEPVRIAAEKAMEATANNTHTYLLVCVAYTSSHEIPRAIYEACEEKSGGTGTQVMMNGNGSVNGDYSNGDYTNGDHEAGAKIKVVDIDKHMYMAVAPDPDVLVRSSGETRLSNFLLWQTVNSVLFSPKALWPEMGLWEVVWGVLKFQRSYKYLEKKKKQA